MGQRVRVVALLCVVAGLAGCSSSSHKATSPATSTLPPLTVPANRQCAGGGCGVVDLITRGQATIIYHGRSCSGAGGSWYLNAAQSGGPLPWPSYQLKWAFAKGSTEATPNGTVAIKASGRERLNATLRAGRLNVRGTDKNGTAVNANGLVTVRLDGTPPSALTVSVSGLAESLALTTPFGPSDKPVRIPLKVTNSTTGCL